MKWCKKKRTSKASFSPDKTFLPLHKFDGVNYLTSCQIYYDLMDHTSPIDHGRELRNGKCLPMRYSSLALPDNIAEFQSTIEMSEDSLDRAEAMDRTSLINIICCRSNQQCSKQNFVRKFSKYHMFWLIYQTNINQYK